METLLNNAKLQLKEFGKIRFTYITNRDNYSDHETTNFDEVEMLIENVFFGSNDDDIQVPHPNYF